MNRGYFGIGIEHGKTPMNIGTLWRSADLLGADFIFTVHSRYRMQCSDTMKSMRNIPLYHYSSIDDLVSHFAARMPISGRGIRCQGASNSELRAPY